MTDVVETQKEAIDQESKNMALLMWIGTIFFGFIPGLVFYLVKKDDKFITAHAKEALNWSITAIIAYTVALILTVIFIGALLMPVIGLCHLIFCVMGAVKASNGVEFKAPIAIRLLK